MRPGINAAKPVSCIMRVPIVLVAICVALAPDSVAQTQIELNTLAGEVLRKADDQLNAVYKKLQGRLSAESKQRLLLAQQSWLKFRDYECEFESVGSVGGSIHSMIIAECLARITSQRSRELERLVNCQEGDLSCSGI